MAVSFNKEFILEAIQEVLAEDQQLAARVKSKSNPSDPGSIEVMTKDKMNALKRTGKVEVEPMEEDHSSDPNAKYEVKPCGKEGEPWAVWEGEVRVKGFATEEEAQAYADKQNKEQGLNEGTDLYEKDGFQFTRFSGGKEDGPSLQITTDKSQYIQIPGKKLGLFMSGLEKAVSVFDDMSRQLPVEKEDTLDEIKKAEFEKIKPGKELQLRGYGVVKVIENDGIVMKIKDSLDKIHTINLGQYNEKFLKEARKRGEKTVRTELDATIAKMKELAKKYKEGDKSVIPTLKDLTVKKKALSAELEKIVAGIGAGQEYKGEVDESLTENKATCCGKCGRTHVKGTECKKPFLTGKDHCRVR